MNGGSLGIGATRRSGIRDALPFLLQAWRTITWRQIAWTAGLGLFAEVLFITVSHAFTMFLQRDWSGRLKQVFGNLMYEEATAFFFLLCIVAADHAVRRGAPRIRSFALAILVAALLGAAFNSSVLYATGWFDQPFVRWWWKPVHPISHFLWYLLIGGFVTFVYADLQRNRESATRLHAATLRRTHAARDVLQTRLLAMQARVEPQFLFDTLARIREIYRRDAKAGQQTLDDLIVHLRTAMPQMHSTTSTLAREVELVRTYVAIVAACGDIRIRLTIDMDDGEGETPFPPMLLLPLVEHAVACCRLAHSKDGAIALRVRRVESKLQVIIAHDGTAFAPESTGDAVRRTSEHLSVLFDGGARVDLRRSSDSGSDVVMELPG